MVYTSDDVLTLAKRFNNPKRSYLLVNPLQAKHIPVSPEKALLMMRTLGEKLARKYPKTGVVIGFAETATAIGAAVAESFPDCFYIHTTREELKGGCLEFLEEHSHAAEQRIYTDALRERLKNAEEIIFVDDELSTGKTLLNIISQLKKAFPGIAEKRLVAASIINRLSDENEAALLENGVLTEYLVKAPREDYTETVARFEISPAEALPENADCSDYRELALTRLLNPRMGALIKDYTESCRKAAEVVSGQLGELLPKKGRVLVLGTEELMYPALIIGSALENKFSEVMCHATTRSPIGVLCSEEYPIKNGYKIRSFYGDRDTFIYNLQRYDAAVVISDSERESGAAMSDLAFLLKKYGCDNIFYLRY